MWIRVSDVEGCVRSDASRRKSFARGCERWMLCTELWIAAAFKEYRVSVGSAECHLHDTCYATVPVCRAAMMPFKVVYLAVTTLRKCCDGVEHRCDDRVMTSRPCVMTSRQCVRSATSLGRPTQWDYNDPCLLVCLFQCANVITGCIPLCVYRCVDKLVKVDMYV